jgi:PIN domain nuclease of toxin-antitoxin system
MTGVAPRGGPVGHGTPAVLDAYALLAYLRGEAAAEPVARLLRVPAVISGVNAAEVVDRLVRLWGRDADDVEATLGILAQAGLRVLPLPATHGILAGRLRARHYHRERMPVSLADCVAVATALSEGWPLATSDPGLAALMRAEGGSVHPLPDSAGRLP